MFVFVSPTPSPKGSTGAHVSQGLTTSGLWLVSSVLTPPGLCTGGWGACSTTMRGTGAGWRSLGGPILTRFLPPHGQH